MAYRRVIIRKFAVVDIEVPDDDEADEMAVDRVLEMDRDGSLEFNLETEVEELEYIDPRKHLGSSGRYPSGY